MTFIWSLFEIFYLIKHFKYYAMPVVPKVEIDPLPRNMLLTKNPQFSPNFNDTLSKSHNNWAKIVDFF